MVILITVICVGFSIESTLKLEQRFDPMWFVPERTHLFKYLEQRRTYYPTMGFEAGLYMGSLNYSQEIGQIKKVSDLLIQADDVGTEVTSWVDPFRDYVYKNFRKGKESLIHCNILLFKSF